MLYVIDCSRLSWKINVMDFHEIVDSKIDWNDIITERFGINRIDADSRLQLLRIRLFDVIDNYLEYVE